MVKGVFDMYLVIEHIIQVNIINEMGYLSYQHLIITIIALQIRMLLTKTSINVLLITQLKCV